MKTKALFSLSGILALVGALASAAQADECNAVCDSSTVSPIASTMVGTTKGIQGSSDVTAAHKLAILNGQQDAIAVLNGQSPSDLFMNAAAAAEALTGEKYESHWDAAIAIIALAEQLK